MGLAYSFRGLIHYCHGGKLDSLQVDVVLEKELGELHLDLQATGINCDIGCSLSTGDFKAHPHSDTLT